MTLARSFNTVFDPPPAYEKVFVLLENRKSLLRVIRSTLSNMVQAPPKLFSSWGECSRKSHAWSLRLIRLFYIISLNTSSFSWGPQVNHFGRLPQYSVLVFDNRGVGNSGTPSGRYTTSFMAEDVIVLLDYIGWTQDHDFHVVGVSLGGMIAQGEQFLYWTCSPLHGRISELSTRIPERIVSLSLVASTPGGKPWTNFPPVGVCSSQYL